MAIPRTATRNLPLTLHKRVTDLLEIPVPWDLVQADNTVSITYSDTGGHISSVALRVFNFTKEVKRTGGVEEVGVENHDPVLAMGHLDATGIVFG